MHKLLSFFNAKNSSLSRSPFTRYFMSSTYGLNKWIAMSVSEWAKYDTNSSSRVQFLTEASFVHLSWFTRLGEKITRTKDKESCSSRHVNWSGVRRKYKGNRDKVVQSEWLVVPVREWCTQLFSKKFFLTKGHLVSSNRPLFWPYTRRTRAFHSLLPLMQLQWHTHTGTHSQVLKIEAKANLTVSGWVDWTLVCRAFFHFFFKSLRDPSSLDVRWNAANWGDVRWREREREREKEEKKRRKRGLSVDGDRKEKGINSLESRSLPPSLLIHMNETERNSNQRDSLRLTVFALHPTSIARIRKRERERERERERRKGALLSLSLSLSLFLLLPLCWRIRSSFLCPLLSRPLFGLRSLSTHTTTGLDSRSAACPLRPVSSAFLYYLMMKRASSLLYSTRLSRGKICRSFWPPAPLFYFYFRLSFLFSLLQQTSS